MTEWEKYILQILCEIVVECKISNHEALRWEIQV